jgi:hypothetical protein
LPSSVLETRSANAGNQLPTLAAPRTPLAPVLAAKVARLESGRAPEAQTALRSLRGTGY